MNRTMWRRLAIALLIALSALGAGCFQRPEATPVATEVVIPPPPTEAPTQAAADETATPLPSTPTVTSEAEEPTATVESPTPTVELSPTAEESPTREVSPTVEVSPTPSDTPTPEPSPTPAVFILTPGQSDAAPLAEGGFKPYGYDGLEFQPALLFVEPADTLDVGLSAYQGDVAPGGDPGGLTPLNETNLNTAGGPEILVITPEEDGRHTLVVRSVSGEGGYTAYLYDAISDTQGAAVRQADTLATGQTKTYAVQSNGARPVIVFADPTDQSNLVVRVTDSNGNVAAEANFSGPGSAEALFVLPLQTTTYTVQVSETSGATSSYNVAIITLE